MPEAYQRKQYLVDRVYQLRFVRQLLALLCAIVIGSSLLTTALVGLSLNQPDLNTDAPFIAAVVAVTIALGIELLIGSIIVWVVGIRQSHRVVGPMTRLTRMLEAIGQGDFSQRITLRKGDALEDLARTINRMAENLERRFPRSPR